MKSKFNDWNLLQFFTVLEVCAIVTSAIEHANSVEAASISGLTIEKRLSNVREQIKQKGQIQNYSFHTIPSLQENSNAIENSILLKQQEYPPDWNKWGKV